MTRIAAIAHLVQPQTTLPVATAAAATLPAAANMSDKEARAEIVRRLKVMQSRFQADKAKGMDVVYQFLITGPGGGIWHAIVKDGKSVLKKGRHPKPTVEMEAAGDTWQKLIDYEINRTWAVVTGKLKIRGPMDVAKKFRDLYPDPKRPAGE